MTEISRRSALLALAGVGAVTAAGGVAWAALRDDASESGTLESIRARAWRASIGHDQFTPPVHKDGTLYCYDPQGVAYALDLRTGALRWKYATNLHPALAGPVPAGNRLIVGGATGPVADTTTGKLLALDRETGRVAWQHSLAVLPVAKPIPGTDLLGVGDQSGLISGRNIDDAREAWRIPARVSGTDNFNGIVRLEASDERLYAVYEHSALDSRTHMLTAIDEGGAVLWSVDRQWRPRKARRADPGGEPQLVTWLKPGSDGLLHVLRSPTSTDGYGVDDPSTSEELITCRADTGEVVWRLEAHRIDAPPRLVDGVIYLKAKRRASDPAEVRAIDARTGEVRWSYTSAGSVVAMLERSDQTMIAVGRDAVCAGGGFGFVVLDRDSGKELWSAPEARGYFGREPVASDDAVFVTESSNENSVVRAWQLRDGKPLRTQEGLAVSVHLLVEDNVLIATTVQAIHAYPLPLN
ncbi:PQQ-binding-like beta-propeller repeat protein [Cryptosporangium aurantiacum]|uniref:Outer membrane protein assembly factor BamB, contains PQQ-like beta-propeller repeat n=1 Tax=Cryptosporangium aurantiacum TaxID=134849 RepID=A0A1M7RL19_9ACTN|nr:PQQ-binding-like beta-propeller repeat protein [Cryptosporangium aurantiacum]SHN47007.1 Outer membrane protein assembly factor BamB, contains PQQ-like beta-propeller repeat [Cryptosporangium aurantiacum]